MAQSYTVGVFFFIGLTAGLVMSLMINYALVNPQRQMQIRHLRSDMQTDMVGGANASSRHTQEHQHLQHGHDNVHPVSHDQIEAIDNEHQDHVPKDPVKFSDKHVHKGKRTADMVGERGKGAWH